MMTAGTPVRIGVTFTNDADLVVDPDEVTILVQLDGETIEELDVTRTEQGVYTASFTPAVGGQYRIQALGTGVASSAVRELLVAPGIRG